MKNNGFTLVEVMAASFILVIVVTLSLAGFVYALRESQRSSIQQDLDIDVQKAMESLKVNMRLSSLTNMVFYPAGPGPYTAVSFPLARDDDGDGIVETTNGAIIWDKTLVYHVWSSIPNQLRLTTLDPRGNLNATALQNQLNYVVTNGYATNLYMNGKTEVVFENLFNWTLAPKGGTYDGYSPSLTRERASLGMFAMTPGSHTFQFAVTGSNLMSKGYKVGVDTLTVSPCGAEREGEAQLPVTSFTAGSAPYSEQIDGGSWSENHHLVFPAVSTGQQFTLTMSNDRWEETTFQGTAALREDTTVVFETTPTYPQVSNMLVRLAGPASGVGQTWYAADQTGDTTNYPYGDYDPNPNGSLRGCAVRVLIRGDQMMGGGWIPYDSGKAYFLFRSGSTDNGKGLNILSAYISECASSTNMTPDSAAVFHTMPVYWGTLSGWSGAYAYCNTCAGWRHVIDKKKSYLVSFLVGNGVNDGYARTWKDKWGGSGSGWGCYVLTNATASDVSDPIWSTKANLVATNLLFAIESMYTFYPSNGMYTSEIFDTAQTSAVSGTIAWDVDMTSVPSDHFQMLLKSGNSPDLSDASWSAVSAGSIAMNNRRYLQFKAVMQPDDSCGNTPRLRSVTTSWTGPTAMVDVGGVFTKGPEYGIFELTVDGKPLTRGLTINLQIYKDQTMPKATRRVVSALTSEIWPRNK